MILRRAVALGLLTFSLSGCVGSRARQSAAADLDQLIAGTGGQVAPCEFSTAARSRTAISSLPPDLRAAYFRTFETAKAGEAVALTRLAAADLALGDTTAALSSASIAVARDASYAPAWGLLADIYCTRAIDPASLETRAQALEAAARAVETGSGDAAAWRRLGLVADGLFVTSDANIAWDRFAQLRGRAVTTERHPRPVAAALAEWTTVRARLTADVSSTVDDSSARRFAQQVRELLLNDFLPAWSEAILAGDVAISRHRQERFRALAETLSRASGDKQFLSCGEQLASSSSARRLAEGYSVFGQAMNLYAHDRGNEAASLFQRSARLLRASGSVCVGWVDAQYALILSQDQHASEADRLTAGIITDARSHGFRALEGRAAWTNGLTKLQLGQPEQALASYRIALAAFSAAKETDNLLALNSVTADALRRMGEHHLGWVYLANPIGRLDEVVTLRRRYNFLLNASVFASDAGLPRAAIAFQNASLATAQEIGLAGNMAEALSRRAHLFARAGDTARALQDLDEAAGHVSRIPSPTTRRYQEAWLARYRGEVMVAVDAKSVPAQLGPDLTAFFSREEPNEVPSIYLDRARALRRSGNDAKAAEELASGIDASELLRRGFSSDRFRVSYLDSVWPLHDELTALRVARGDVDGALELSLSARDSGLARPRAGPSSAGLRVTVPAGTSLIYFVCLDDRLLSWQFTGGAPQFRSADVSRDSLGRLVSAYRALIDDKKGKADLTAASASLTRLLLPDGVPPSVDRFVIVPDGPLQSLPFDALLLPATQQFLAERASVVLSLTANAGEVVPGPLTRPGAALLVRPESPLGSALGVLTGAADELNQIARLYTQPARLEGLRATPAEFRREAGRRSVIHFAGHSQANAVQPWSSALLMAPDVLHPDGVLSADEIGSWSFHGTALVVLGSCESAIGAQYRGEGIVSLARPFLVGGAETVVGALWQVDDQATQRLLVSFHQKYAGSLDAARALGAAKREMLGSQNPADRLPYSWAGFAAITAVRR